MLRGEHTGHITRYADIDDTINNQLSSWLANIYFEIQVSSNKSLLLASLPETNNIEFDYINKQLHMFAAADVSQEIKTVSPEDCAPAALSAKEISTLQSIFVSTTQTSRDVESELFVEDLIDNAKAGWLNKQNILREVDNSTAQHHAEDGTNWDPSVKPSEKCEASAP